MGRWPEHGIGSMKSGQAGILCLRRNGTSRSAFCPAARQSLNKSSNRLISAPIRDSLNNFLKALRDVESLCQALMGMHEGVEHPAKSSHVASPRYARQEKSPSDMSVEGFPAARASLE